MRTLHHLPTVRARPAPRDRSPVPGSGSAVPDGAASQASPATSPASPATGLPGGRPGGLDPSAMTRAERVALWKQRLLEAVAGMTTFLLESHDGVDLADWLHGQAELFAEFPDRVDDDPAAWQRTFFRAQALMERFVVARYGEADLDRWSAANAAVLAVVEPERTRTPVDVIDRIARQAELYASDYEILTVTPAHADLAITHCAIWDYRELARAKGVGITLDSPCTFCTGALSSAIRAKGYDPSYQLTTDSGGHGCRWRAATRDPDGAERASR